MFGVQQAITARCIATGIKLLVIDNLSTAASGMKENDTDAWEMVNNWLLDFRRRKIAVILVHHAGRNGEMRGASKREDNAFWVIVLDDAKKQTALPKRGHKPVVTPERVQMICGLIARGETECGACLRAGIGLTAWSAAKRSDAGLRDCIASARDEWARLRHAQRAAALYESQAMRSAGRKALKPQPMHQASLWYGI